MKQTVLALIAISCVAVGLARAEGAPKIQFDVTVYDFGTVSDVEKVTGTFTFKNMGDAVLKLDKPTTSCGCTVASLKPEVLPPGEKGELTFTLNIPATPTKLEKQIYVNSNDPLNPRIALSIKANHQPIFDFNPRASMLVVRKGTETNLVVQIRRTDGKKLSITKTESGVPWITAKAEPVDSLNESSGRVMIHVKPDPNPRWISEAVRIYADQSEKPQMSVWLHVRVVGDITLNPETLFWGINNPALIKTQNSDALLTRQLVVTSTIPGQPLELHNAKSDRKEINVELVRKQTDQMYVVIAKLTEIPQNSISGNLSFETNIPSQPRVQVPITVSVFKR